MILTTFDVKFNETKDEIPPGGCRPSKKMEKNNVGKVDAPKVKKPEKGAIYNLLIYIYMYVSKKGVYEPSEALVNRTPIKD